MTWINRESLSSASSSPWFNNSTFTNGLDPEVRATVADIGFGMTLDANRYTNAAVTVQGAVQGKAAREYVNKSLAAEVLIVPLILTQQPHQTPICR